ncbi:MAG TPA: hypothetical protein DHW02_04220 [Ktedonobacter sp.]|nr:hypothetical protein [Ktedonobacter sp.]
MANDKPSQKKVGTGQTSNKSDSLRSIDAPIVPKPASTSNRSTNKQRKSGSNRPQIGGSAVAGAKSTQPRPTPTSPQEQQRESYNREMRRRMDHLGTGPQSETDRAEKIQKQRNKRIERRKQRVEDRREEARKRLPVTKPGLGRRNTIFLIAVAAALIILFIVFALLRFYFHVPL